MGRSKERKDNLQLFNSLSKFWRKGKGVQGSFGLNREHSLLSFHSPSIALGGGGASLQAKRGAARKESVCWWSMTDPAPSHLHAQLSHC